MKARPRSMNPVAWEGVWEGGREGGREGKKETRFMSYP